jgi:predicted kinase
MAGQQLIVFGGVPSAGKTALARALARQLQAVYLDKSTIKDEALRLAREMRVEGATQLAGALSYTLLMPLARDNLTLGQTVILDSPAGHPALLDDIEDLVRDLKVDLKLIECITTDENLLRQRIEERSEGSSEQRSRDGEAAQQARARLERLSGPRLVVDTAELASTNLPRVLKYLE